MVISLFHSWRQHSVDKSGVITLNVISFLYIELGFSIADYFSDKVDNFVLPQNCQNPIQKELLKHQLFTIV